MAGDWIKLEHVTPDKPEVGRVADVLDLDEDAVVGKLVRLWIWADQQSLDGHALSVTFRTLDRVASCAGFASALETVGWLECHAGCVTFVNFERHNGETAKKRALANRRKARQRAKVTEESPECHADGVTFVGQERGPEKRREEKSSTESGGTARAPEARDRFIEGFTRPTEAEAIAAGAQMMLTEEESRDWWDARESSGWRKAIGGGQGTTPVGENYRSDLRQFVNRERDRKAAEALPIAAAAPPPGEGSSGDKWSDREGATVVKFSTGG